VDGHLLSEDKICDIKKAGMKPIHIIRVKVGLLILMAALLMTYGCVWQSRLHTGVPSSIEEVPRISVEELNERVEKSEAILIVDMRSFRAFEAIHIKGAVSVPIDEIESRLDEFPSDRDIVFYCS
jgi:hypothetical protein